MLFWRISDPPVIQWSSGESAVLPRFSGSVRNPSVADRDIAGAVADLVLYRVVIDGDLHFLGQVAVRVVIGGIALFFVGLAGLDEIAVVPCEKNRGWSVVGVGFNLRLPPEHTRAPQNGQQDYCGQKDQKEIWDDFSESALCIVFHEFSFYIRSRISC